MATFSNSNIYETIRRPASMLGGFSVRSKADADRIIEACEADVRLLLEVKS